jgi:hypothetical protein
MEVAKTVQFDLMNGDVVTLDMSEKLVKEIEEAFGLENSDAMTEEHVKYYLVSGMRKALEAQDVEE